MASASDRKKFYALRARYIELTRDLDELDVKIRVKYGPGAWTWASSAEKKKRDQMDRRMDAIVEKFFAVVDRVSSRDWHHGVPMHWVMSSLSWEDATTHGPLSTSPPKAYGY